MTHATVPLGPSHLKTLFSCGQAALDKYLHQQAKQDIKRKLTACFVLSANGKNIQGYYTLANGAIPRAQLPVAFLQQLPHYKDMPVTLLGRLAVDQKEQGKKLGEVLLIDALKRSWEASSTSGSWAMVVDPLDQSAQRFYEKFGFFLLPDSQRLFLPMATVEALFVPGRRV